MEINHRIANGVDILEFTGRFDAYEVSVVSGWFDANPQASNILINLQGVMFIDSSALSVLVKGLKRCRQNGGDMRLCNLQQPVRLIFELTRLNKAFTIFVDEADALEAIST